MGEVYRARDSRLEREVAIKILPADFTADPERRIRFEREARASSQLNHPNILALYDVGVHDGTPYIVSELLEGETLRDRLRQGPLPVRKAIEFATFVARALGTAQEKGITHRDVKPENIFVCNDGQVKILDFGLVRLAVQDNADSDATILLSQQTAAGVVLGTASYMSPEQARGRPADARSDIFSLGAVLYEMLSGKRPFTGDTFADLLSAILKEDPPPLPANVKAVPALERVVLRCLEKNPSERFQSARDLAFQLESMNSALSSGSGSAISASNAADPSAPSIPRFELLRWMPVVVGIIGLIWAAWWFRGNVSHKTASVPVQFERLTDFYGMEESPSLSPDGKSVAFVSDTTGTRQIWIRLLAGGPPLQLTHEDGDHLAPRWSADSASLFYYTPPSSSGSQATVWEISALGGTPRRIVESLSEVDPSHDGKSLAFFRLESGKIQLVRTDRDAGNVQILAEFPSKTGCRQPRWSPNDSHIAFISATERWADDLHYIPSAGGSPQKITSDAALLSGYSWLPDSASLVYSSRRDSTLLYLSIQHLWSISLDGTHLRQLTFGDESDETPDVDSRGRLVEGRRRIDFDIWKFPIQFDPAENVRRAVRITHQTGQLQTPSLSPDGRQLVYLSDTGGHGNLWVLDLDSRLSRQITFEKAPGLRMGVPLWSPNGAEIAYARNSSALGTFKTDYWSVHPDGSNHRLFIPNATWFAWAWDSKWAYYTDISHLADRSLTPIQKVPTSGGSPVEVRNETATGPAPAPDGETLYFLKVLEPVNGLWDYELRSARPENAASELLARIPGRRVPDWQGLHPVLSSDAKWLALPLADRLGTNLWLLSTADGKMHPITDFGDRRTFIARRVAWSPDNKYIFAAVGDGDSDIILLDNLFR